MCLFACFNGCWNHTLRCVTLRLAISLKSCRKPFNLLFLQKYVASLAERFVRQRHRSRSLCPTFCLFGIIWSSAVGLVTKLPIYLPRDFLLAGFTQFWPGKNNICWRKCDHGASLRWIHVYYSVAAIGSEPVIEHVMLRHPRIVSASHEQ